MKYIAKQRHLHPKQGRMEPKTTNSWASAGEGKRRPLPPGRPKQYVFRLFFVKIVSYQVLFRQIVCPPPWRQGMVRSGQVRSGQVRLVQVFPLLTFVPSISEKFCRRLALLLTFVPSPICKISPVEVSPIDLSPPSRCKYSPNIE